MQGTLQPVIDASYTSVRRRPLDIEDYIDIVRRHKAWILGPAFGALVIAVVVAFLWPDTYISSAIIRVVPSQVPENFVPSNVNVEMSQRINSMAQTILSRGNLTNIINTYNLYPRQRQRKPMEDVIEEMKNSIRIGQVVNLTERERGLSAFQVQFSYHDRILAQKVVSDLVTRFISENTRDRTNQSMLTTQFLNDQWEQARQELQKIEERLAKFRTENAGRLPDQVQQNWTQLSALENRVANINGAISRTNQDKLLLETELRTQKAQLNSLSPPPEATAQAEKNDRLLQIDREIANIETHLAMLREQYKDAYPDVQRAVALLNIKKKERDNLAREQDEDTKRAKDQAPVVNKRQEYLYSRERQNIEANIQKIEALIRTRTLQAEEQQKELEDVNRQIRAVQARLNALPVGEQQYAEIVRDRELAKQKYDEYNKKKSQSEMSSELEKRQQGETLDVLDPASLPQKPTEPNRTLLVAVGAGMGIVFGLMLAGAREAKDTSLKNLKDVRAYTQLTILGSVPLLENDLIVRRRRRLAMLAWSTACLLGVAIMTGAVVYYRITKV
ncbi:MAG TPA: Wzz/FepE/Etk N-terminal domain-containing protein [Bryobacteraceae bacterium]|nr:Wzz/FepE/Etk N-terminal domain-containing protein [Bryobacteraceae bacterium]